MKNVIVPQEDIDKVEAARLRILEVFHSETTHDSIVLQGITEALWKLTHRKYKEAD